MLLTVTAGLATGLALGAVGGGGSILLVPLLVLVFGRDAHAASGTALAVVGATALLGAALHARAGHVRIREAALFAVPGIAAAAVAAPVNQRIPGEALLGAIAVLMLVVAWRMWRPSAPAAGRRPAPVVIAAGAASGALTGVLGVGGGFVIVPALVLALGMPMADAVGTSLAVIAANAAAALGGYWLSGDVEVALAAVLAAGAGLGVLSGSAVARRAGSVRLQRAFAVMLVLVAVYTGVREAVLVA